MPLLRNISWSLRMVPLPEHHHLAQFCPLCSLPVRSNSTRVVCATRIADFKGAVDVQNPCIHWQRAGNKIMYRLWACRYSESVNADRDCTPRRGPSTAGEHAYRSNHERGPPS